jgi:hypothetical protein
VVNTGALRYPHFYDFLFEERYRSELMYDSGVLSSQPLIVAMAVSTLIVPARLISGIKTAGKPCIVWFMLRQQRFNSIGT